MKQRIKYKPFPKEISNLNISDAFELDYEVFSCKEASKAKNIPLKHELKTIILSTSKGFVAVHICGDKKVSLRGVKNFLKCKEARLCSLKELSEMGLSIGTVCPLHEPVWSMYHLISEHILNLKYVSTNNSTRMGYYIFSPKILLLTKVHKEGLFTSSIYSSI